ncbi:MAG: GGDEF domain-containing protein [Culicoidibacterales bacterium]
MQDFTQLERQLEPLLKFFDAVRIVNPLTNQTLLFQQQQERAYVPKHPCYKTWNRNTVCDNCIAMQALRTQTTSEKLEYVDETIFLVLATPITIEDEHYVIEALRDVTDSSLISKIESKVKAEIAKEIAQLNAQIVRDPLTQAYNRKYLMNRLPTVLAKSCIEDDFETVVAIFDLDNFKGINDQYGHLVGDLMLQALTKQLENLLETTNEWFVRLGGDEFVLVVSSMTSRHALERARAIYQQISQIQITFDGEMIGTNVSIGFAIATQTDTVESLLHRADQAMYQQKEAKV